MPITKATASSIAPAAKGDLVVGSATNDAAVLGVGSNDQVLTADSSTATGLKWAAPASGGMTLISEQVASANSSIDFNSIPGTYKQLILVWSGIIHSNDTSSFDIRFNSSSSAVYVRQHLNVSNSTVTTAFNTDTTVSDYALGRRSNNASLWNHANGFLTIDNYASTTRVKPYNLRYSFTNNDGVLRNVYDFNGFFNDTTAISSVNIYRSEGAGTFSNATNTSIRLYGLS